MKRTFGSFVEKISIDRIVDEIINYDAVFNEVVVVVVSSSRVGGGDGDGCNAGGDGGNGGGGSGGGGGGGVFIKVGQSGKSLMDGRDLSNETFGRDATVFLLEQTSSTKSFRPFFRESTLEKDCQ